MNIWKAIDKQKTCSILSLCDTLQIHGFLAVWDSEVPGKDSEDTANTDYAPASHLNSLDLSFLFWKMVTCILVLWCFHKDEICENSGKALSRHKKCLAKFLLRSVLSCCLFSPYLALWPWARFGAGSGLQFPHLQNGSTYLSHSIVSGMIQSSGFEWTWTIVGTKIVFSSLLFFFLAVPRGILIPQPGIEPVPPALGAWSLSLWTARELPSFPLLCHPHITFFHDCVQVTPSPNSFPKTPPTPALLLTLL